MSERRSFFAELRRRNVYKVAVAYGVVAWLVIQIASTVVPALHLPESLTTAAVVITLLGFPIALVIAWAFEMTPEGMKRTENIGADAVLPYWSKRKFATVMLALALVGVGFLAFRVWRSPGSIFTGSAEGKSIAILPFQNLSEDKANEYFAEGIQEEILTRLSKIADLKVISRISTQKYKTSPGNLREIAEQLGVANVLEGSIQKAADQVRVSVQLINANTDAHLWAETYDRRLTDIFAVESEIARAVAETLQAQLSGSERHAISVHPTTDSQAHELYLKGRYLWNRRTGENLKKALVLFQQAAERDPNYALAYSGIADTCGLIPVYGGGAPRDYLPRAKAAATKAVELDDSLAEAHASLGRALVSDFKAAESAKEFERAIALNPNYATAHHWYGRLTLPMMGDLDHAMAESKRAVELDPVSPIIRVDVGSVHYLARRYDEAIAQYRDTLEMSPEFYFAHRFMGLALELKGATEEAIAEYRKALLLSDDTSVLGLIGHAEASRGREKEAREILAQLSEVAKTRYIDPYAFAVIHIALGEKDQALDSLEQAVRERCSLPNLTFVQFDPYLDPLRGDPRFEALVSKILSGAEE